MTERRWFGASEVSVRAARKFVAEILADVPDDIQESVSLMVSELATNALVHAVSGFDVTVDRAGHSILVSVSDRGDGGMPRLQAPASSEPHGRGLHVVSALSEEWGVSTTWDEGKTVWFRISVPSATPDPSTTGDPSDKTVDLANQDDRTSASSGSIISANASRPDAPNSLRRGIGPRFLACTSSARYARAVGLDRSASAPDVSDCAHLSHPV